MYFGDEEKDERDPFEVFGELETADETVVQDEFDDIVDDGVDVAAERESDVDIGMDELFVCEYDAQMAS